MTLYFLVVLTHFLLNISNKNFAGHFFSHLASNIHLSPFHLQIDYVDVLLLVGYQLFSCALQAISNEGNSANNRGENMSKQTAAFPSLSSTQKTARQEVLMRRSQLCGHTLMYTQRSVWDQKEWQKRKSDTGELLFCFPRLSAVSLSSNTQPKPHSSQAAWLGNMFYS